MILGSLSLVILLCLAGQSVGAQESSPEEPILSADQLLKDAILFRADVSVASVRNRESLWDTTVNKITIPGRAVSISLEGAGGRLEVVFTPYPGEEGRLLLVARSQTWFNGDYTSDLASLPIEYSEVVHYYPLGRAVNGSAGNPVEILVKIRIVPFLESLDDISRAALESALDASAQFRVPEEVR